MKPLKYIFLFAISLFLNSCQEDPPLKVEEQASQQTGLFEKVPYHYSGVDFFNFIRETPDHNIFRFDYMYNGGGVAIGDINNDGLPDIYFTGNMANNRFFLNQGNFKFKDITENANLLGLHGWSNGATMVDINNDGYLDIYLCRSYFFGQPENRRNHFYINNKNNFFFEKAEEYGVDDPGFSTQATFFDYDSDGDMDLFVANHPENFKERGSESYKKWQSPSLEDSNKLYRNNGDQTFTDVTEKAGLLDYAFSLGVVASDFNDDGHTDLFISNDYDMPDQYWVNNGDGTFTNQLDEYFKHISNFGMGVDAGDINNDGHTDLITVDMLAEDNYREKTQMGSMEPDVFWMAVEWGYHYQYMRNSLHLNNGNGYFSEIGQLAGIHRTDWSWAPLLADFDNDGWKDLYISNGFRRDSRNKDVRMKNDKILTELGESIEPQQVVDMLNAIPSTKVKNYLFHNNGDYSFSNISDDAGIGIPSFSNGSAYADLDNDGDLDLVVNNLLDTAFIFKNTTIENGSGNYLRIQLIGNGKNPNGFGAKVSIYHSDKQQKTEHTATRGYLSSVELPIHFGLGQDSTIDRIEVRWPDKTTQTLSNIKANQMINIEQINAKPVITKNPIAEKLFKNNGGQSIPQLYKHEENLLDDYEKQILLPHKMSQFGPCIAVADVNGDGHDDFYIGGAKGQDAALYQHTASGYKKTNNSLLAAFTNQEDVGAHFFDADSDGDMDLYVVAGGNAYPPNDKAYKDRLHINDGKGNFSNTSGLPDITSSGSVVVSGDYDHDGDMDLFVGGRHRPGAYPSAPNSYLLENQNGTFVDVTEKISGLGNAGMVTSAIWVDLKKDKFPELILAGEWMPIRVFDNQSGKFTEVTKAYGLADSEGWWNSLAAADIDKDGDLDIVAGNLGLNYKYQASAKQPFHLYSKDFDANGNLDIVLAFENEDGQFPVRGRQCSAQQIPDIKNKFPTYNEFGASNLNDIYGDPLKESNHFMVKTFASSLLLNNGNASFTIKPLPPEAQFAPINSILIDDFDKDNELDLLVAGNLYVSEIETGRADAGTGLLLKGNGSGAFTPVPPIESGFWANQDVKSLNILKSATKEQKLILVGNNNAKMQVFESE